MPLTLNEKTTLAQVLSEDENISRHYSFDNLYDMAGTITDSQKKYIYALLGAKKYIKLRNLLIQLGTKTI